MIYIITFLISAFLLYLYEHNKVKGKFIIFLALLLPCVLAGMRNIAVGTDTDWYPKLLFDAARYSKSFFKYNDTIIYQNVGWGLLYKVSSFEIGFSTLVYLVAKIFNNFHILLFFIQIIIIFPIYYGLKKNKYITENKLIWLSMIVFYLFCYNWGLNAIRQSMATSIIFWGISSFINDDKGKWKKYLLSLIIAISFHTSAIISIIILIIYLIARENNKLLNTNIIISESRKFNLSSVMIIVCFLICCLLLFVPFLLRNIALYLNINHKYINYIGTHFSIAGSSIFLIPIIFMFFMYRKQFKNIYNHNFYMLIYILYMFSIQLSTDSSQFGSRISFFFLTFNTVGIPMLANSPQIKNNRRVNYFIVILIALVYWIYNFVFRNYGETYPYAFYFINGGH